MSLLRLVFAAVAAAFACVAQAAPLEAYGALPSIESVSISPDGAVLAAAITRGESRGVMIKPLPDGAPKVYGFGPDKIRRLDWVGSKRLVVTTSQAGRIFDVSAPRSEYMVGSELDLETQAITRLLKFAPGRATTGTHIRDRDTGRVEAALNVLVGPPEVRTIDGEPTLFLKGISFPDRRGVLTVFRAERNGATRLVELGEIGTNQIILGGTGEPVAKSSYDSETGVWTLKLARGNGWAEVRRVEAKLDRPYVIGLGRDGRSVVMAEFGEKGWALHEVSPDGELTALEGREDGGPIFDPATHRLIGLYALVGDEDRYTFFNPADQAAWASVRSAFKGLRVRLESWSADRKRIVVLVDHPADGQGYAIVDLNTRRADWLGARYSALKPQDISPVRPVAYKAKDGLDLTGYLTVPKGVEAKNLPLVVFPHGGPASRDEPGFDWWAQAMASRGYAVLQVNFRGSDGFGWPFLEAGFGEWGRKMQTDLSDGVRHLAAQGVVDPKRVCIVGASYGGYAALAGASLDAGVYRCAASVAGLSDLRRFVAWSKDNNGLSAFRWWTRFMGAEGLRDEVLEALSPARQAERISIPILLVHGRDDTVVPLEQSRIMASALERAGKPVELIVQDGEDHWLSRSATRQQMLTSVMAFVETHNPPR